MQDKISLNEQRQRHGIWEEYHCNGRLFIKTNYHNDLEHGRFMSFTRNGKVNYDGYYVYGEKCGFHIDVWPDGTIEEYYAR